MKHVDRPCDNNGIRLTPGALVRADTFLCPQSFDASMVGLVVYVRSNPTGYTDLAGVVWSSVILNEWWTQALHIVSSTGAQ